MCHVIPGFVAPQFVGFVLGSYGDDQWKAWDIIFYSLGSLMLVVHVIFVIFIKAEKQDFDDIKEPPPRDFRSMSVVSALSHIKHHL